VEQGRPEHCQGAHAVGHNSDLGICLIGNFSSADGAAGEGDSKPTAEQMNALVELCRRLQKTYNIPLQNVRRHRDVSDGTECPGDNFPFQDFMRRLGGSETAGR
jgi:N-acetyl-anhydromuramyl-L-alanine amidase AmpD